MIVKISVEHIDNDNFRLTDGKSVEALNPKELLLYATACCAGKTVTGIFDKQRIHPEKLEITMYGDLDTEKVMAASVYNSFRIIYRVKCDGESTTKAYDAVKLADEKYCGTLKMMRRIAPVRSEITVNEIMTATA